MTDQWIWPPHDTGMDTQAGPAISRLQDILFDRALVLWPRLDRRALARCGPDVDRIAALVSRRTALSREDIVSMLRRPRVSDADGAYWFG